MRWMKKSNGYQFMDGTNDSPCHKSGPQLLHFRNSNISTVHERRAQSWSQILEDKIPVPATSNRAYSDRGYLTSEYIQDCTSPSDNSDILLQTSQITQAHHYSNRDQQFFIEDTCIRSLISEPSTSEQIAASATCLESARCGFSCISDPFTTLDATDVASNTDVVENDFTPTSKTATMSVICIPDTSLQSHDSGFVETKLCKSIEKCTGPIDELRKLDLLRKLLKDRKHKRQQLKIEDINTYQHLLSQLKMTIIKKKENIMFLLKHTNKTSIFNKDVSLQVKKIHLYGLR